MSVCPIVWPNNSSNFFKTNQITFLKLKPDLGESESEERGDFCPDDFGEFAPVVELGDFSPLKTVEKFSGVEVEGVTA